MNITQFFRYQKLTFILVLKRTIAYPAAFWLGFLSIPLWSIVGIFFIEIIYGQTTSFVGYSKYEMYVLFGTYRLAVNTAYFIMLARLFELTGLIRCDTHETFDMVLVKPIDSQIYGTTGRYSFIEISQIIVGISMITYGLYKQPHSFTFFNIFACFLLFFCGVLLLYIIYLVFRSFIFWFQEFQVSEGLYETLRGYGRFPSELYTGITGLILNLLIPVTLTAGIPVDFLFGKIPQYMLFIYIFITGILFFLSRKFWLLSVKKYASFSS